jgi:hypothetical protein
MSKSKVTAPKPIDIEKVRAKAIKVLGVKENEFFADMDKEYPDCLCAVVLDDVGPDKMDDLDHAVRRLGVGRICANVLEKQDAAAIRETAKAEGHFAAWKLSWDLGVIATVRS